MATLYKRYIPPKPTSGSLTTQKQKTPLVPAQAPTETPEKKRKRERTQEEVAERKAKKLKKKGIDPAAAQQIAAEVIKSEVASEQASRHSGEHNDGDEDHVTSAGQSDFSHIKSVKKRHKLEKAAREARKVAEKNKKANGSGTLHEQEEAVQDLSQDEEQLSQSAATHVQAEKDANNIVAKKARKKAKQKHDVDNEDPGQDTTNSATAIEGIEESPEPPEEPPNRTQPKKRRHKLEAVLEEGTADRSVHEDDDEHLRKHSALLDKFQKSASRAVQARQEESFDHLEKVAPIVVRNLELPDRGREPTPEFASENAALPPWLAHPTVVPVDIKQSFGDIGLDSELADRMKKLGFITALPVQQSLIPILLPPGTHGSKFSPLTESVVPDVAVSAPTGSGKTIAYMLPIVEALKMHPKPGKLTALIVVPTRELVLQVASVAESLAKGSNLKVGMATGNSKVVDEQRKLIKRGRRYGPIEYKELMTKARHHYNPPCESDDDFGNYLASIDKEDSKSKQQVQDAVEELINHVPVYDSAVDIIVATPGRLLEHLNSTVGFNLVHLQWLVMDEADKLLDNEHEGFLEALNVELDRPRTIDEQDEREKYLRKREMWDDRQERRLRKVILSATMTRDISKLAVLRLKRPRLIVVGGGEKDADNSNAYVQPKPSTAHGGADLYELPRSLMEYCVPVGDGSEKPLVLIELLSSRVIEGDSSSSVAPQLDDDAQNLQSSDDDSSSDAESDSSLSSDDSTSSNESGASEIGEDQHHESNHDDVDSALDAARLIRLAAMAPKCDTLPTSKAPTILIFTSSNEAATRLSHLLKTVKNEWSSWVTTIVKTKPGQIRVSSKPTEPAIVISTDRAARGLDSISNRPITHIVQYDVPRSVTSYVHRVGRTARAGREGDAWTLFTHNEARWFVKEITQSTQIRRTGAVDRIKIFMADARLRQKYQKALADMKDEVHGGTQPQ